MNGYGALGYESALPMRVRSMRLRAVTRGYACKGGIYMKPTEPDPPRIKLPGMTKLVYYR